MPRPELSVTIITLNEESNIERTLKSVIGWADEVLVCDSGSIDRTRELAEALGARVIRNPWLGYGQQKNFAQGSAKHDWVLNIDADEVVSPELRAEIDRVLSAAPASEKGYRIKRRTYYGKKWIRHGGWYPNEVTRLANRRHARWSEPQIHEALIPDAGSETLKHPVDHYSFNGILDQAKRNVRYARLSAERDASQGIRGSWLKLLIKPKWKFFESYVLRLGFLDGAEGFMIAVSAAYSMFMRQAHLIERSRSRKAK